MLFFCQKFTNNEVWISALWFRRFESCNFHELFFHNSNHFRRIANGVQQVTFYWSYDLVAKICNGLFVMIEKNSKEKPWPWFDLDVLFLVLVLQEASIETIEPLFLYNIITIHCFIDCYDVLKQFWFVNLLYWTIFQQFFYDSIFVENFEIIGCRSFHVQNASKIFFAWVVWEVENLQQCWIGLS